MVRCSVVQGHMQMQDPVKSHPSGSIHDFFGLANNKPSGQSINSA